MFKINKNLIKLLGSLFVFIGITTMSFNNYVGGFLIAVTGLLILPSTYLFIDEKTKNFLSKNNFRVVAIVILFSVAIAVSPKIGTDTTTQPSVLPKTAGIEKDAVKNNGEAQPMVNGEVDIEKNTNVKIGTVVKVSDGDTIRVKVNDEEMSIRLIGINTPEINHQSEPIQCYGPEAKEELERLILNKEVKLEKDVSDVDKYDRYLRYIWFGETLINEHMTRNGYAFASSYPPDTKYQQRINGGQVHAKVNSIGLWAKGTCDGNVYTGTYKDPNLNVEPVVETPTYQEPAYVAPVVPTAPPPTNTQSGYTCSCSKTCGQMASCEEAYFQLNSCGCSARDGDGDGIPCESICN